jgi:hypothetical protein
MIGPLPVQVSTWLPQRSGYGATEERDLSAGEGEWLYCLKHTQPGDRQAVWSGVHGRGIIAVVDFSGDVRPRTAGNRRLYEGWGRVTPLGTPIDVDTARHHPVLSRAFGRPIQGVQALGPDVGAAIGEVAGGLPPKATFDEHAARWDEEGGDWSGHRIPPEAIVEAIVLRRSRIARLVGFPSQVNPSGKKQRLGNGRCPDLWCTDGVVGDAKNQVTAAWGPAQIEDYIDQCDVQWPHHEWRGVLVQGEPEMAPNAEPRLRASRYADRIQVWRVRKRRIRYDVVQLYPPPRDLRRRRAPSPAIAGG